MKKGLILAAAALLSASAFAQVTSANVVGYVKKDLVPGEYMLVGTAFTGSNASTNTLKDILGSQLTQSANYLTADRVIMWSTNSSSYQAYAMYTDGEFYPCNTADEWNNAVAPVNPNIPVGTGFWIVPASGATETNSLVFSGDVVSAATNEISIVSGYQMINYPFSSAQEIATLDTSSMTASANYLTADRIGVWTGGSYQYYGLYTDYNWYPCNDIDQWNNAVAETDYLLDIGEGFWFIAQQAQTLTETNKYINNL